jgi:hypothetical protein
MSASLRAVTTAVMASGIAAAIALPAVLGQHGDRQLVSVPGAAGRQTVRVQGLSSGSSSGPRRSPAPRSGRAAVPRRLPPVDAPAATAAVSVVRPSTPRVAVVSRPAATRPRRPTPHPALPPAPKPAPAPQPPAPAPVPAPAPASQPAAQQQVQTRELDAQPHPAPPPAPASAAQPAPPPHPAPPPFASPSSPDAHDDNRADDNGAAHDENGRAQDDASAERHDSAHDG